MNAPHESTIMAELDELGDLSRSMPGNMSSKTSTQNFDELETLPDQSHEDDLKMLRLALEDDQYKHPQHAFKQRMNHTEPLTSDQFETLVNDQSRFKPVDNQHDRRQSQRYQYDQTVEVVWHLPNSKGETEHFKLKCQDISNGGLAIVHSARVPDNVNCTVTSFAPDGKQLLWTGQVRHCTKVNDEHYLIGVAFDYAIDVTQVIAA